MAIFYNLLPLLQLLFGIFFHGPDFGTAYVVKNSIADMAGEKKRPSEFALPGDTRRPYVSYDRILKKNFERFHVGFLEKELGIKIAESRELNAELASWVSLRTDFVRFIRTKEGGEFLAHVEFQTRDDPEMGIRMQEYHGTLVKKTGLPVVHIVVYLGGAKSRMKPGLPEELRYHGFHLVGFRDVNYEEILASNEASEIIFAVLCNFNGAEPTLVLSKILRKLGQLEIPEEELKGYFGDLICLSKLRNLEKTCRDMIDGKILVPVGDDPFYNLGVRKTKRGVILRLIKKQVMSDEEIAEIADVPIHYVLKLREELQ